MRKLIFTIALLLTTSPLWSHSIKFVAMDKYYDKVVPIDSILVYDMNSGEEKLYLTDSIYFETISSVAEVSKANNLQLFPNPVEDILNINLNDNNNSDLILSDLSGRVHFTSTLLVSGQISLNVAGLTQGVYAVRIGNQSHTFIKNTTSNGQEVSLLSTSHTSSSLVKESEIQSQYDYRFTIYSEGFKPKTYYSKSLYKDTIVELDMSTLTGAFDGKHIRVELFFDSIKHIHYDNECNEYIRYNTNYQNLKIVFIDTLILRGDSVRILKQWESDLYKDQYEYNFSKSISFKIDSENNSIVNFKMSQNKDTSYHDGEKYYRNKFRFNFNVLNNIKVNLAMSDLYAKFYLDELQSEFKKEDKTYYTKKYYACQGHWIEDYYSNYNPSKSYIKIEIID